MSGGFPHFTSTVGILSLNRLLHVCITAFVMCDDYAIVFCRDAHGLPLAPFNDRSYGAQYQYACKSSVLIF